MTLIPAAPPLDLDPVWHWLVSRRRCDRCRAQPTHTFTECWWCGPIPLCHACATYHLIEIAEGVP